MKILFFLMFFCLTQNLTAQILIKGVVKSAEDKMALPGVTIKIKGAKQEIFTNVDGEFEINVPDSGAILIISFIGFISQEIIVKNNDPIEVILEEDTSIIDYWEHIPTYNYNFAYEANFQYTPFGVRFEAYRSPFSIHYRFAYQTNFQTNHLYFGKLGYRSFYLGYQHINVPEIAFDFKSGTFSWEHYIYEAKVGTEVNIGISVAEYWQNEQYEKLYGVNLGLQRNIFQRFWLGGKATYWKDFWQFRVGLSWWYKRLQIGTAVQHIDRYTDFSIKAGWRFYSF